MDSNRIAYICAEMLLLALASLAISYSTKLSSTAATTDDELG